MQTRHNVYFHVDISFRRESVIFKLNVPVNYNSQEPPFSALQTPPPGVWGNVTMLVYLHSNGPGGFCVQFAIFEASPTFLKTRKGRCHNVCMVARGTGENMDVCFK